MSSITAAAYFFSDRLQHLTGRSINVVLVEEGTPNLSLIRNLNTHYSTKTVPQLSKHANKIASLVASQELGIAPDINLFCLNHSVIYENRFKECIQNIVEDYGKVDLSIHAYSGIPSPLLFELSESSFRDCQRNKDTQHLIIAAAGHDGLGLVRYPACLPYVLAVGVCQDSHMCHFSGYNLNIRKPELLVENNTYLTYQRVGDLSSINGTSAGVAVTAGIAALWAEKLKKMDFTIMPSLLKAILLATSNLSSYQDVFLLSKQPLLDKNNEYGLLIQEVTMLQNEQYMVNVRISQTGTMSCTFVADLSPAMTAKFTLQPEIKICLIINNKTEEKKGLGWINVKLSMKQGDDVNILISSSHKIRGFLVMTNVMLRDKNAGGGK
jgi:hypothetical protein